MKFDRISTQPMTIDYFNIPATHDISERLWVHHKFNVSLDCSIPTCIGVTLALKLYAVILIL